MIKIYLTDLAAYNAGYLIGEWIELPLEKEELDKKLENILKRGSQICQEVHEEFFITDFESDILDINEYSDIYNLNNQAELLSTLCDFELKIVKFLISQDFASSIEEAIENIENVFIYEDSTMEDIAFDFVNEIYDFENLPSIISSNIDYKGVARDLESDGTYYKIDNDIYEYI